MNDRERRIERAKQTRLEKLGTNDPICKACGENHWAVFESHHIAGCKYCALQVLHCKNCHAKASAMQKGHPPPGRSEPSMEETIGKLLLGLADFFELLIETLRKFGEYLIEKAGSMQNGSSAPPEPSGAK
jgi:hypothetical protein